MCLFDFILQAQYKCQFNLMEIISQMIYIIIKKYRQSILNFSQSHHVYWNESESERKKTFYIT